MKQFKAEIVRVDQVQSDKEGGGVSNRIKKTKLNYLQALLTHIYLTTNKLRKVETHL